MRQHIIPPLLWLACIGMANGGEIIISPVVNGKVSPAGNGADTSTDRLKGASDLRNKARTYKSGGVQPAQPGGTPVLIQTDGVPEIEEGVLLPRGDEIPALPRTGSHESVRGGVSATVQGAQPGEDEAESVSRQDIQQQLEKNRFKAHQYMKSKPAPSVASSHNGDNHVVACESSGNVSGRIGDDSMSGREIIIIRDGKQVKMRCK